MTDLWREAAFDHEAELRDRRLVGVRIAVAGQWPFLAGAETHKEFEHRRALVSEHLEAAVARITNDDPGLFIETMAALDESLNEDFETLFESRKGQRLAAAQKHIDALVKGKEAREAAALDKIGAIAKQAMEGTTASPFQKEAVSWSRQHYEDLAAAISQHPERQELARHFAERLSGTNPQYRREQFEAAAGSENYAAKHRRGPAAYSKGHYEHIADALATYPGDRESVVNHFTNHLSQNSSTFKPDVFRKRANPVQPTAAYTPGRARMGEPTPQTHPDQFSDADIHAEIKHLMKLNEVHGEHPLRTVTYRKLMRILQDRQSKASFNSEAFTAGIEAAKWGLHVEAAKVPDEQENDSPGWRSSFLDGIRAFLRQGSFRKGAPMGQYKDFDACVAANQDKRSPEAYCGKIKSETEDKKKASKTAAERADQHGEELFKTQAMNHAKRQGHDMGDWESRHYEAQPDFGEEASSYHHSHCKSCGAHLEMMWRNSGSGNSYSGSATQKCKGHIGSKTADERGHACTSCNKEIDPIDAFPGGVCVDCWAKSPEGQRMPTADELTEMWGGKPRRPRKQAAGLDNLGDNKAPEFGSDDDDDDDKDSKKESSKPQLCEICNKTRKDHDDYASQRSQVGHKFKPKESSKRTEFCGYCGKSMRSIKDPEKHFEAHKDRGDKPNATRNTRKKGSRTAVAKLPAVPPTLARLKHHLYNEHGVNVPFNTEASALASQHERAHQFGEAGSPELRHLHMAKQAVLDNMARCQECGHDLHHITDEAGSRWQHAVDMGVPAQHQIDHAPIPAAGSIANPIGNFDPYSPIDEHHRTDIPYSPLSKLMLEAVGIKHNGDRQTNKTRKDHDDYASQRSQVGHKFKPKQGKTAGSHDPIAYTYEADYHCPECAKKRFGTDEHGDIPESAQDREGNPVGAVAPWDEWQQFSGDKETLACGTCGKHIEEYDPKKYASQHAGADTGIYCPTCKGTGAHPWERTLKCPKCKGTGLKRTKRTKQVEKDLGMQPGELTASRLDPLTAATETLRQMMAANPYDPASNPFVPNIGLEDQEPGVGNAQLPAAGSPGAGSQQDAQDLQAGPMAPPAPSGGPQMVSPAPSAPSASPGTQRPRPVRQGFSSVDQTEAKIDEIAEGIMISNPGIGITSALELATQTVERFPGLVSEGAFGTDVDATSVTGHECPQCSKPTMDSSSGTCSFCGFRQESQPVTAPYHPPPAEPPSTPAPQDRSASILGKIRELLRS